MVHWKDWCWSWNSNILATSCEELTHWKRPWCWEGLGAGGEADDRGWDAWMTSPTQWTWVWVNSGSWWWTGRPGVLQFMGLQRVGHDWVTELNWRQNLQGPALREKAKSRVYLIQSESHGHGLVFLKFILPGPSEGDGINQHQLVGGCEATGEQELLNFTFGRRNSEIICNWSCNGNWFHWFCFTFWSIFEFIFVLVITTWYLQVSQEDFE